MHLCLFVLFWLHLLFLVQELATHCRRKTRGAEETLQLIGRLVDNFTGAAGQDTLGVPLFDIPRRLDTWKRQKEHTVCIQDPPGVSLYRQVGTRTRGDILLPVYRCARGSTSLESFHLHLNRFIPGKVYKLIVVEESENFFYPLLKRNCVHFIPLIES